MYFRKNFIYIKEKKKKRTQRPEVLYYAFWGCKRCHHKIPPSLVHTILWESLCSGFSYELVLNCPQYMLILVGHKIQSHPI